MFYPVHTVVWRCSMATDFLFYNLIPLGEKGIEQTHAYSSIFDQYEDVWFLFLEILLLSWSITNFFCGKILIIQTYSILHTPFWRYSILHTQLLILDNILLISTYSILHTPFLGYSILHTSTTIKKYTTCTLTKREIYAYSILVNILFSNNIHILFSELHTPIVIYFKLCTIWYICFFAGKKCTTYHIVHSFTL